MFKMDKNKNLEENLIEFYSQFKKETSLSMVTYGKPELNGALYNGYGLLVGELELLKVTR